MLGRSGYLPMLYPTGGAGRIPADVERVLFVDPGLEGTGWAFFPVLAVGGRRGRALEPEAARTIRVPAGNQWESRAAQVCGLFSGVVAATRPAILVLEQPEVWGSSPVSLTANRRGDLLKLAYLVGGLAEVGRAAGIAVPVLVPARRWKGQLPKDEVRRRIRTAWKRAEDYPEHAEDAVGMGLAAQVGL